MDRDEMAAYLKEIVEDHKIAMKEGRPIKDFITVYLKKLEEERNKTDSTFSGDSSLKLCLNTVPPFND